MIRRDFLKYSSAIAAGTSLIGNSRGWAGANDRIRIAITGMGWRGGQLMPVASKITGVEVATLCDPDERRMAEWGAKLEAATGKKAILEPDLRKIMDDGGIDAVLITSCNHWHALTAIWACQANKHLYVEKPVSHNISEGRKMMKAVRKYNRIAQGGTQRRSSGLFRKAIQLLHQGVIGDIYMARALVFRERDSIGFKPVEPPPSWLRWDLWKGPGPNQPYHANLVHYNWHWFWDFGNGELANNGSHIIDVARWGLGKGLPSNIHSVGGRFGYKDQAQTPNTQISSFEYNDGTILTSEIRGLYTNAEPGGAMFYGSKGYMTLDDRKYQVFMGRNKKPEPDQGRFENVDHVQNFIDAVRMGKREILNAELNEIFLSNSICHLGNISYRLGRELHFDPEKETFTGDEEANRLLTREYRKPFVVPDRV